MWQVDLNSQQKLAKKIDQWKAGLADLSLKNPLLNFKPNNSLSLEIIAPQSFTLFKDLVKDKKIVYFQREGEYKIDESEKNVELRTRQTQDEALKRFKKLRSEARLSLEEKGVNTLFLAFGTLTWCDIDNTNEAVLSPLILVPVELAKEPKRDVYKILILEGEIAFNPALLLRLKQKFGIDFPEKEMIQGKDYNELISQIRQLLPTQTTWKIEDNIFLSLFSYAKAAMVRDIIENEARILNHPILQAISGDLQAYQKNFKEPLAASKLDSHVKPELMFQVLDADSSQQVVIEAAKTGSSFVVQGPPGTGKSQTIVNMITELIGEGKSVLLVAEKETALQVVSNRMNECGLGDLCLSINYKSTSERRKFVDNLTRSINSIEEINSVYNQEKYDVFFSELESSRGSINSYITVLHTKTEPLNMSPFELYGELLKMQSENVPDLKIIFSNFSQWTQAYLNQAKELLSQVSRFLPFFYGEKKVIWAKSYLKSYSFEVKLELEDKIKQFQKAIDRSQDISQYVQENFHFSSLNNLLSLEKCYESLSYILKAPIELPEHWTETDIENAKAVFAQLKLDVSALENFEQNLLKKYSSNLFSLDLSQLSERYQKYSRFWFIRIFNFNYWRDYRRLRKLLISPHKVFHHEFKRDLIQAAQVQYIRNQFDQNHYPPRQIFGSLFNPQISQESELQPIEQALSWLTGLQRYLFPANLVQQIINFSANRQALEQLVQQLRDNIINVSKGLDFLLLYFKTNDITGHELPSNKIDLHTLKTFLERANSDLSDFQGWLFYQENRTKLSNMGTENFLSILCREKLDTKYWFPVLKKSIYQTCLDAVLAQKTELKFFDAEKHKETLNEFASLDQKQLEVSRERLKQIHITRWREWKKIPTSLSELQSLKKESMRRKKHLPIRKLLNDREKGIPNLVKTLKPCWMMSPLAVSQYIDPDVIHFDVLIFDEASQLRTEDVVSSIIRADQIIVIGDNKQLPPTSFFAPIGDGDGDGGDLESVLDECSTFMFRHILKWHYRSQDERLIAFSNRHFYYSQLVTFPNPIQNPDLGVYFKHVPDGIFDAGAGGKKDNRREAAVVAQLTLEHFQQRSDQSLGIIAFSKSQADAIQEQIESLGRQYQELQKFCQDNSPQFFLKALENVQGDERDVILLSVGYGHNAQGKFHLNLGPITNIGGERRLNVAITRAKSKIILVSSIRAGDIDLSKVKTEGVKALRDYLGYVESGGQQLQGNAYSDELKFDSPFEADVYYSLKERPFINDYIIRTQVGCSGYRIDLAIAHNDKPGQFLLGIECDGASYHSSPTARDRDRLRQQILERLGWKFHRIWSTEWFRNKRKQIDLLIERIKQIEQGDD